MRCHKKNTARGRSRRENQWGGSMPSFSVSLLFRTKVTGTSQGLAAKWSSNKIGKTKTEHPDHNPLATRTSIQHHQPKSSLKGSRKNQIGWIFCRENPISLGNGARRPICNVATYQLDGHLRWWWLLSTLVECPRPEPGAGDLWTGRPARTDDRERWRRGAQ